MAECLRQRYIQPAYTAKPTEQAQALKRKAPNLSNADNPGTRDIYNSKLQRCHLGVYKVCSCIKGIPFKTIVVYHVYVGSIRSSIRS